MVALRDKGLREVSTDPALVVLRMLCDRRDELSRAGPRPLNRMHRLFLELLPGGRGEEVRQPVPGAAGHRPAP